MAAAKSASAIRSRPPAQPFGLGSLTSVRIESVDAAAGVAAGFGDHVVHRLPGCLTQPLFGLELRLLDPPGPQPGFVVVLAAGDVVAEPPGDPNEHDDDYRQRDDDGEEDRGQGDRLLRVAAASQLRP